jgi:hypothetical protein
MEKPPYKAGARTGFSNVKLTDLLPADSKVTLKGSFENLEIVSDKISVEIPEGSVQKVTADTTATGMTLCSRLT